MWLLLAEDEPAMAEAITAFLQYHQYTVDWVDNGADAYSQASSQAYDGLILDIMMPEMDGLTVLSRLRREGKNMPVLMLTAKSELEDRIKGLDSGADDYLPKPFDMSELLARVRAMLRRRDTYHPETINFGGMELTPDTCQLSANGKIFSLSRREYQLMELFMAAPDHRLGQQDICDHLWPKKPDASATLYTLIRRLKNILDQATDITIECQRSESYQLITK